MNHQFVAHWWETVLWCINFMERIVRTGLKYFLLRTKWGKPAVVYCQQQSDRPEHMSSDPWSVLTRSGNICRTATPSFLRSGSWWCCLVEHQHFPFSLLHSHFLSFHPSSLDPWICKVRIERPGVNWHCVGSPLKLFKVEFSVTVFVKPCHHSFHLTIDRTKSFLFLFTWVGVIALFIIWNSFFVMNPSLSLSRACKVWPITMDWEFASMQAKRPNSFCCNWSMHAMEWKRIWSFVEYLERENAD